MSGVGRGMGVLDGGGDRQREGSFEGKYGASHSNQWGLCCVLVQERRALPKLLWGGLVYPVHRIRLSNRFSFCMSVCLIVNRSATVVERLRGQFFADFHQILHAGPKSGRFDA